MEESLLEDIRAKIDRKFIAEAKGIIIDCAKHLKSNDKTFNIVTLPDHMQALDKAMLNYIDYVHEVEASEKAFTDIFAKVEAIDDGDDEEYVEAEPLIEELDTLVSQVKETLVEKERDAIEELNKVIRPQEQETRSTNRNAQTLKDPITKLDIKVPVQSNKCKHVFEKETIESYLENSKKCPQAGCTNKRMTVKELVSFDVQESSPIIIS